MAARPSTRLTGAVSRTVTPRSDKRRASRCAAHSEKSRRQTRCAGSRCDRPPVSPRSARRLAAISQPDAPAPAMRRCGFRPAERSFSSLCGSCARLRNGLIAMYRRFHRDRPHFAANVQREDVVGTDSPPLARRRARLAGSSATRSRRAPGRSEQRAHFHPILRGFVGLQDAGGDLNTRILGSDRHDLNPALSRCCRALKCKEVRVACAYENDATKSDHRGRPALSGPEGLHGASRACKLALRLISCRAVHLSRLRTQFSSLPPGCATESRTGLRPRLAWRLTGNCGQLREAKRIRGYGNGPPSKSFLIRVK